MKRRFAVAERSSPAAGLGAKGLLAGGDDSRRAADGGAGSELRPRAACNWTIGERIHTHILKNKRAGYGEQIFYALSRKLTAEFGRGFTKTNLFNMVRFAEAFPDAKVVDALSTVQKAASISPDTSPGGCRRKDL